MFDSRNPGDIELFSNQPPDISFVTFKIVNDEVTYLFGSTN